MPSSFWAAVAVACLTLIMFVVWQVECVRQSKLSALDATFNDHARSVIRASLPLMFLLFLLISIALSVKYFLIMQ